jgi:hypothetical protein
VSVLLVLGVNFFAAVVLLAVALAGGLSSRLAAAVSLLLLLDGALLVAYVFGEDSYRDNGISRWEAYRSPGGALGPMFVASLVALAVTAGLVLYAAVGARRRLLQAAAASGGIVCVVLVTVTVVGFSLN